MSNWGLTGLPSLVSRGRTRDAWFATGKLLGSARAASTAPTTLSAAGGTAWRCGAGRPDGRYGINRESHQLAPFTAALFRSGVVRSAWASSMKIRIVPGRRGLRFTVRAAGLSGVYVPSAWVTIKAALPWAGGTPRRVRRIARNQVLLVAKHYPRDWISRYGWPVLIAQGLWGLVALRHGAGWLSCKASWKDCTVSDPCAGSGRTRAYCK